MTNTEQYPGPSAYLAYKRHKNDPQTIAALDVFEAHLASCNTCHDHGRRAKQCATGRKLERAYNYAYNTAGQRRAAQ